VVGEGSLLSAQAAIPKAISKAHSSKWAATAKVLPSEGVRRARGTEMTLLDGLTAFENCLDSDLQFTLELERSAADLLQLMPQQEDRPDADALAAARKLLIEIEKWKAMCLKQRMGNAALNSSDAIWQAFRGAINAKNDVQSILAIMNLRGFGSARDEETGQRRAKVASAVLRFLFPEEWGVVDWRTIVMQGLLDKVDGDVDAALKLAKRERAADLRDLYDLVDETAVCAVNSQYRTKRCSELPRTADVEMAIFGLSVIAWPFPKSSYSLQQSV